MQYVSNLIPQNKFSNLTELVDPYQAGSYFGDDIRSRIQLDSSNKNRIRPVDIQTQERSMSYIPSELSYYQNPPQEFSQIPSTGQPKSSCFQPVLIDGEETNVYICGNILEETQDQTQDTYQDTRKNITTTPAVSRSNYFAPTTTSITNGFTKHVNTKTVNEVSIYSTGPTTVPSGLNLPTEFITSSTTTTPSEYTTITPSEYTTTTPSEYTTTTPSAYTTTTPSAYTTTPSSSSSSYITTSPISEDSISTNIEQIIPIGSENEKLNSFIFTPPVKASISSQTTPTSLVTNILPTTPFIPPLSPTSIPTGYITSSPTPTRPVDCKYTGWGEWSKCQPGNPKRTRKQVVIPPSNGGKTCNPKTETDTKYCPVNSTISGWSDWTPCKTGSTKRTRVQITVPPINNGSTIIPKTDVDMSTCSIDCEYTGWGEWTTCHPKNPYRTRTQTFKGPFNNGKACNPQSERDVSTCPVDSEILDWDNWSSCELGSTTRTRTQSTSAPMNNGATVMPDSETDNSYCVFNCMFSLDLSNSTCDKTTGTRMYSVNYFSPALNNGNPCKFQGTEIEYPGQVVPSTDICPVESTITGWTDWTDCVVGTRVRNRTQVTRPPLNNGSTINPQIESDNMTCPIDCTYTFNTVKNECDYSTGTKIYTVNTYNPPVNNGKPCKYQDTIIYQVGQQVPSTDLCPIDCCYQQVYDGCTWDGYKNYNVTYYRPPVNNGLRCTYNGLTISQTGKYKSGDKCPVDCTYQKTFISCRDTDNKRDYTITNYTQAINGGVDCSANGVKILGNGTFNSSEICKDCYYDSSYVGCVGGKRQYSSKNFIGKQDGGKDCSYGITGNRQIFSKNESCTNCSYDASYVGCIGGKKQYISKNYSAAVNGGDACPNGVIANNQTYMTNENCTNCVGSWSAWGPCSVGCGGGKQSRKYTVTTEPANDGALCPNNNGDIEYQNCNTNPCPVNCVGSWSEWSKCSVGCGGGNQSRTYTVTTEAANGGIPCPNKNGDVYTQECNKNPCPLNCIGSWSDWSECSSTCGEGTQSRTYTVALDAINGGIPCSINNGKTETQKCNVNVCDLKSEGKTMISDNMCLVKFNDEPKYIGNLCNNTCSFAYTKDNGAVEQVKLDKGNGTYDNKKYEITNAYTDAQSHKWVDQSMGFRNVLYFNNVIPCQEKSSEKRVGYIDNSFKCVTTKCSEPGVMYDGKETSFNILRY